MRIDNDVTREMFRKGLNILPGHRSATSGMTEKESQAFRAELVKTLYSLRSTQEIIKANSQLLTVELKDNKVIQDALKNMGEGDISKTIDSVLKRKDVDNKEAKRLVDYMEKFVGAMESVDASLTVSMPMILDNLSTVLNDDTLSVGYRKEYLLGIQKMLSSSEVTKTLSKDTVKEIEKLTKIQGTALNFTEKELDTLNWTLTALKEDAKDVKIYQTLKSLDKNLNASVLTNKELKTSLKMQNSTNTTLKEMFEKQGGAISQGIGEAKSGIVKTVLAATMGGEVAELFGDLIDGALSNFFGFLLEGTIIGEMTDKIPLKDKLKKLFNKRSSVLSGGSVTSSPLLGGPPNTPLGGAISQSSPNFIGPPRPPAGTPAGTTGGLVKRLGGVSGILGKTAAVVSAGFAIKDVIDAQQGYNEQRVTEKEKNQKQGKAVGGLAGMIAGGEAGAAIGTLILPGVGTVLGGLALGIIGGIMGSKGGESFGGMFGEATFKGDKTSDLLKKARKKASGMFGFIRDTADGIDGVVSKMTGSDFKFTSMVGDFITGRVQELFDFLTKIGGIVSKYVPQGVSATVGGVFDKVAQAVGAQNTTANGAGMKANAKTDQAMAYFQSQGWTKEQAAGIVGNLQVESGNMRPDVIAGTNANKDHGSMGVAQWRGDRVAQFKKVMGKDLQGSSYEDQLAFIQWELTHTKKAAGNVLKGTKTAGEAAVAVDNYYEVSDRSAQQKRINAAVGLAGEGYVAGATPPPSSTAKAAAATNKPALSNSVVTPSGQVVRGSDSVIPMKPEGEASPGGFNYVNGITNPDSPELARLAAPRHQRTGTDSGGIPTSFAGNSTPATSMPSAAPVGGGVNSRRLSIDDYGLAITNSLMFG